MKADELQNWEKRDLANILAERLADEEDLIEAFPAIASAGAFEESLLDDYIESNWPLILSRYDEGDLKDWMIQGDLVEVWESWKDECAEEEFEYQQTLEIEYYRGFVEMIDQYRYKDLAELRGLPAKKRVS